MARRKLEQDVREVIKAGRSLKQIMKVSCPEQLVKVLPLRPLGPTSMDDGYKGIRALANANRRGLLSDFLATWEFTVAVQLSEDGYRTYERLDRSLKALEGVDLSRIHECWSCGSAFWAETPRARYCCGGFASHRRESLSKTVNSNIKKGKS